MKLKTSTLYLLSTTGLWTVWLVVYTGKFSTYDIWWSIPFFIIQVVVVCIGLGISLCATSIIIKRQTNKE